MNNLKPVKRRTFAAKLRDRRRHLAKRHGFSVGMLRQYSYFNLGVLHMGIHIRLTHKEALRHNA